LAAAEGGGQTLGQLNFFGNSGAQGTDGRETLDLLKEIEATGDDKRDPGTFVDDGGSRQRLELFSENDAGEAVASDDLLALILAAIEEQADLEFFETDTGFDIHVGGRWSTDILRFEGETAQQLVTDLLPPDNIAPDAMDDVITITAGETLTDVQAFILANDSDPDGDDLSVLPDGFDFSATNPELLGIDIQFDGGAFTTFEITAMEGVSGTTSFTYSVSDGNGGTDTATVTVEIEGINNAPVAADDSFTVVAGETTVNLYDLLLANDFDPDGDTFDISRVYNSSIPDGLGFLNIDTRGSNDLIEFRSNAGQTGTMTFDYDITDENGATDTATVTIEVVAPDPAAELLVDFGTYIANAGAGNSVVGDRLEVGNGAGLLAQDNNGFIVLDLDAIDMTREIAGIRIDVTDVGVSTISGSTSELSFFSYDSEGGDITALRSGVFDSFIFDDLSTGTEYATFEIDADLSGDLSFDLQSDLLVQDLEQALADGDDLFALGLDGFADLPTSGFNTLLVSLANPFQSAITVEVVYEDQVL
ncbi:MAG: cadherin-like domain-containing protein, partial [Pseudomonadota bacterium]